MKLNIRIHSAIKEHARQDRLDPTASVDKPGLRLIQEVIGDWSAQTECL